VAGVTYTMGFYFTAQCGYWFLDIDNALVDTVFTPVACHIYGLLHKAAFEYSSSSRGMHFFGRGTLPQRRSIKPPGTGLELYTEGRAVAFGLTGQAAGCADIDFTDVMCNAICPEYFAAPDIASASIQGEGVIFEKPRSDWHGSANDDELLARMHNSSSVQSKFSEHKANFSDLYNGNMSTLASAYKNDETGEYDASAADYALAAHLAFWTGCHAPRMEKLMRASKLYRPKWDSHKNYLREMTIHNVCRMQGRVLCDKTVATGEIISEAKLSDRDSKSIADENDQLVLFEKCVYVRSEHAIFRPLANGQLEKMTSEVFNTDFAKYTFKMDFKDSQSSWSKKAFDAFTGSRMADFPKVDLLRFNPLLKPVSVYVEQGVKYLNSYAPVPIQRKEGDVSLFVDLIKRMYPDERDAQILISWMAACVQHVGVKFRWAPVLQGAQGCGKTTITECLSYAIGRQFVVMPKVSELVSKFNSWLDGKLLIVVNEMHQGRDHKEIEGEIKKLITEGTVEIEAKGKDQYTATNFANFIFTLNDKSGFKKSKGDRRFCVMYSQIQEVGDLLAHGLTQAYFVHLHNWLANEDGFAIVAHYLNAYPIPDEFNPATHCVTAPGVSCENEVYANSKSVNELKLMDAVQEARIGFKNGWICFQRAKYDLFEGRISPINLEKILFNLGYVPHPGLDERGWTDNAVMEEQNKKIRLYCSNDITVDTKGLGAAAIVKRYVTDQM
jgi:hypothetical protein